MPDRFEVIVTWDTTGLAGSGSHDDGWNGLFVPVDHTLAPRCAGHKRDGLLHAIPGGFLAHMEAVALCLARGAIDEAIAVVTDKVVLSEGVAIREGPCVREAIADAHASTSLHRPTPVAASIMLGRNSARALRSASTPAGRPDLSRGEVFRMAKDDDAAMVRLVGTQAIDRLRASWIALGRDAITINDHVAAGP